MERDNGKIFLTEEEAKLAGLDPEFSEDSAKVYLDFVENTVRRKTRLAERGHRPDELPAQLEVLERVAAGLAAIAADQGMPDLELHLRREGQV